MDGFPKRISRKKTRMPAVKKVPGKGSAPVPAGYDAPSGSIRAEKAGNYPAEWCPSALICRGETRYFFRKARRNPARLTNPARYAAEVMSLFP